MAKSRNGIYLTLVLFLVALVTLGSYAFFTWSSSNNKVVSFNTAKELENYIVYDEGESQFSGEFKVSNTYTQGIHSTIGISKTNTAANVNLVAAIMMDVIQIGPNMKQSTALKWVVTEGNSTNVGNVLARGNFIGVNSGDTLTLVPNLPVTTTEEKYTIWIWLDASESPSDSLSGEMLDTDVWTQIDQVEGITSVYEITQISANYQTISATVVNNEHKITEYAVTSANTEPSSWTSIPTAEQANVYNLVDSETASATGTYYVWFKDEEDNVISEEVNVTAVDTSAPVCTFGSWSTTPITSSDTSTIELTCTDNESAITINNLTTSNLTKANNNINITSVTKTSITNGYKYTVTVTGTQTDGTSTITLPANIIKNALGLGAATKTSSAITVVNTCTVTLDKGTGTAAGTTSITATYNSSTISPSTITLASKSYTISGFELAASRNSDGATVSSTSTLTSTATLNGYYSSSSGGTKVLNAATTAAWNNTTLSGYLSSGKWVGTEAKTLYAQFGAMAEKTLPTITKSGYTCGWTTSSTGTTIEYVSGGNLTPTENTTLYGVCVANTFMATLNKDAAAWSIADMNVSLYQSGEEVLTGTTSSNGTVTISAVPAGTYDVYASYNSGNTGKGMLRDTGTNITITTGTTTAGSASATIDYYTITKSQGDNSTIATRYETSSGTNWTTEYQYFLKNSTIYITSSASSGYTATLTVCGTTRSSGYTLTVTSACEIATTATGNNYSVIYRVNIPFTGLDNASTVTDLQLNYSINNGVITISSNTDGDSGYGYTTGRINLEAGKTYYFNCTTDGVYGWGGSGEDKVYAMLMLNGQYNTYYGMESNDNYAFTPTVSGEYWLRLDSHKSGVSHTFSNISVSTNVGTSTCTYGSTCTLSTWANLGATFPISSSSNTLSSNTCDHYWNFAGWNATTTGTARTYANGGSFAFNTVGNLILYAVGQKPFNFDKGIAPTTHGSIEYQYWNPYTTAVHSLTTITIPASTDITSWTFIGYRGGSNTANSTVDYAASTVNTSQRPVYDKCQFMRSLYSRTLTVSYNANSGSGTTDSTTKTQYYNTGWADGSTNHGATLSSNSITLASSSFTRTGYTFSKWAEDSASGTEYSAGAAYTGIGTTVDNTTVSKTMYAKWTGNQYQVSYAGYGATNNTSNLVSKYDAYFNTLSNTHSTNTTTWYDWQEGHSGTITGGTWSTDYLNFNGSSTWVNLGAINNTAYTIEAVVSLNSIQSGEVILVANYESGGYGISINSGKPAAQFYDNNTSTWKVATASTALTAGTKYHIAGTYDGTTLKTYVNGALVGSVSITGTIKTTTNSTVMAIGANPSGTSAAGGYINAKIYSVAIYSAALSASQIANDAGKTITYASTYGTLPTPYRRGYTFAGWYTAASGGTQVTSSTTVNTTSNQTLYAHWTVKTLTVTFNCNGGSAASGVTNPVTYTYGVSGQKFPNPAACTRTGYTGSKWTNEASGTLTGNYSWTSGVANSWINSNSTGNSSKTIYAQWTANTYTITYKQGNGTSTAGTSTLGTQTCTYGETCTLRPYAGTNNNGLNATFPESSSSNNTSSNTCAHYWTFYGWSTSQTGTTRAYTDNKSFTWSSTSDLTLYAIGYKRYYFYQGIAPTSSFSSDQYQYWNPYSTAATYLTSITVPSPTTTPTGWTFYGYRGGSNAASSTVTWAASVAGTSTKPAYDICNTVRGIYSRTLTVSYNKNSGTGTMSNTTKTQYYNTGYSSSGANTGATLSSNSINLAANGFTRDGYNFSKWAEGSTSGTQYAAGAAYTGIGTAVDNTTVSKTMYAIWTLASQTITLTNKNYYQATTPRYNSDGTIAHSGVPEWVGMASGYNNSFGGYWQFTTNAAYTKAVFTINFKKFGSSSRTIYYGIKGTSGYSYPTEYNNRSSLSYFTIPSGSNETNTSYTLTLTNQSLAANTTYYFELIGPTAGNYVYMSNITISVVLSSS